MEVHPTALILSDQLQNLPLNEVRGVLQVALLTSQPVCLQQEKGGLVFKVTGCGCVGDVGGDSESLGPDSAVVSRGVQGLRWDGVDQQS